MYRSYVTLQLTCSKLINDYHPWKYNITQALHHWFAVLSQNFSGIEKASIYTASTIFELPHVIYYINNSQYQITNGQIAKEAIINASLEISLQKIKLTTIVLFWEGLFKRTCPST